MRLGQGDRIGHAIALGVNAEAWARRTSGIAITRMERLLDLAWEWKFSTDRKIDVPAGRIQYLLHHMESLSNEIFSEYTDPTEIAKFAQLLTEEDELKLLGFPHGPADKNAYVQSRSGQARA